MITREVILLALKNGPLTPVDLYFMIMIIIDGYTEHEIAIIKRTSQRGHMWLNQQRFNQIRVMALNMEYEGIIIITNDRKYALPEQV